MSYDEKIVENLKEIKIVTNEEIIEILKKHGDEIPFVVGMKNLTHINSEYLIYFYLVF